MARQYSVAVRNAKQDAVETAIGAAPVIKFFSGGQPANCAAANSGTECVSGTLPADWLAAAANGAKAKLGSWAFAGAVAAGAGTAIGHYRIYAADGVTCHEQGSVTRTGDGGDITVDNVNIAHDQVLTITSYTKTEGNA